MAGSFYLPGLAYVLKEDTFFMRQSGGGGHESVCIASETAVSSTIPLVKTRQMPQNDEHQPTPITSELPGSCNQPPEGQGQHDDKDQLKREVEELTDIIRQLQEFDDWLQRQEAHIKDLITKKQDNQPNQYNYEGDENINWLQRVADDRAWTQGEAAEFSFYITNRLHNELVGRCWIQRATDDKAWLHREIADIYDYITEQQENDPVLETLDESATPIHMESPEHVSTDISQPFTQQPVLGFTQLPTPLKCNDEYDEVQLQTEMAELNCTIRQLQEFDGFIKREDAEINTLITKPLPTKYNQQEKDDEAIRNEMWLNRAADYKVWLHLRQKEYSALIGQLQQREQVVVAKLAEARAVRGHSLLKVSGVSKETPQRFVEQSLSRPTEVQEPSANPPVDQDENDDVSGLQTEFDTLNAIVKQLHEFNNWLQREDAVIRYHQQNDYSGEDGDNEDWLDRAAFDRVWLQEEEADFTLYIKSLQQNEAIEPCWMQRAVDDRAWLQREVEEFYDYFVKRQQNEQSSGIKTSVENAIPEKTQTPFAVSAHTPQHFVHHVEKFIKV